MYGQAGDEVDVAVFRAWCWIPLSETCILLSARRKEELGMDER